MSEIKKNKTSTNFIFYIGYQVLIYLIPFIVSPFLTRTLKEDSLGIFTFSNSIAIYFVLLANLGIARYGQREISNAKENKKDIFWSLFFNHMVFSFIALGAFTVLLFTVFRDQINVYSFCLLYILSALFDISWLFYGRENFRLVTVVNGIFAIIKMILIFLLIRSESDLFIYQILYYGAFLLSNITIFIIALKHVGRPTFDVKMCAKHIKPLLYFSLITLAVTLYTVFDKTIIGIFLEKSEVAFYEYADKIIAIPKMLLLTTGAVLFPKMCSLQSSGEEKRISEIHIASLFFSIGIGIGAIFGLIALGRPVVTYYYGENFVKSGEYIVYMAPLVLLITLGDIFRTQFIIPQKKDSVFLLSVSINAVVNIILSLALVNVLGVLGVIIGSISAELTGCVFQMIYCRKYTNFKKIFEYFLVFITCGFLMLAIVKGLESVLTIGGVAKIIVLFVTGLIIYMIMFVGLLYVERKRKWE